MQILRVTSAKRHASRLMSDAYGKGIVRGQAECTNLRAYSTANDVIHAETFRTSQTESFYGKEYVNVVEGLSYRKPTVDKTIIAGVDGRNPRRQEVTIRDTSMLYGQRPKHPDLLYFSPHEFVMYWQPQLVSYPLSLSHENFRAHHETMTPAGRQKLEQGAQDLAPGQDYIVKDGGVDWFLSLIAGPRSISETRGSWCAGGGLKPHPSLVFLYHATVLGNISVQLPLSWHTSIHGLYGNLMQMSM